MRLGTNVCANKLWSLKLSVYSCELLQITHDSHLHEVRVSNISFKRYIKNGNIRGGSQWDRNVPAIHTRTENTVATVNCQKFTIVASQVVNIFCIHTSQSFLIFFKSVGSPKCNWSKTKGKNDKYKDKYSDKYNSIKNSSESDSNDIFSLCRYHYSCGVDLLNPSYRYQINQQKEKNIYFHVFLNSVKIHIFVHLQKVHTVD